MNPLECVVDAASAGERLDVFLSRLLPELSRSSLQKALTEGAARINDRAASKNYRLHAGDRLVFELPEAKPLCVEAQDIPLDVVYEDDDLLVVNKPKGMVVHPAPGNPDGTLVNALLWHCGDSLSGINGVLRPGIVHRIDKDTSGLLVVAKNDFAHRALAEQIAAHTFLREYRAVVTGHLREDSGTVNAPIGRSPKDRKKMAVTDKNAKPAVTHYETLEKYVGYAYIRCRLETGRTHQIRVHMAYLGHPLAGDAVYGHPKPAEKALCGQCLHAKQLGFTHPRTGAFVAFDSELPAYFTKFQRSLTCEG
ncbi:MAG TPA: RluA family pseudouridine synthase [Candidatus Fimenecus stercoravium]|nr:RluA family pseudouridine synthase [Candidatus Fimenecus stercoravium]